MSRSICIDCSALSPREFDAYSPFVAEFDKFSLPRGGQVRFAEAAQFLRKWFPFDTDREDEIRSFFPQKLQLGQMNQGCVLALLRLLSHLQAQPSPQQRAVGSTLYRDLIFIQTEPLQPLPHCPHLSPPASPKLQSFTRSASHPSNPFRRPDPQLQLIDSPGRQASFSPPAMSPRHRSFGSSEAFLSKSRDNTLQTFSAADLNALPSSKLTPSQLRPPKLPVNPFRQATSSSSTSLNAPYPPGSPASSLGLASPPVPPRPSIPAPPKPHGRTGSNGDDDQAALAQQHHIISLPPPKHYTQQYQQLGLVSAELPDSSGSDDRRGASSSLAPIEETPRPTTPPLIPSLPKISKSRIIPRIVKSTPDSHSGNSSSISSPESNNIFLKKDVETPLRSSNGKQDVVPSRVDPTHLNNRVQPPALPRKSNLLRSQTFNQHRAAPPAPPPRKRPESLQIYNPHSVPLDELAKQKTPSGADSESQGTVWALPVGAKSRTAYSKIAPLRTVSHDIPQGSVDCPSEPDVEEAEDRRRRRRSTSLGRSTSGRRDQRTKLIPSTNHLKQLRALEHGLRADGRELVKDVKEGWQSRHGRREERVRLVGEPNERGSLMPRVGKIWPNELRTRQDHWRNEDGIDEDHATHPDRTSGEEEGWSRLV